MLCVPACSETLTYQKELCEHIGNRATKASNGRVSYHSPLSKLLKTEIKGTHIKYEREIITDMDFISGEVGFLGAISNNRFMVVNNRKKYKNRETKNILTTNVYQQYYKSYIPYNELTNRLEKVHNNKYDYSKVVFTKMSEKVTIICPEHGEFLQSMSVHIAGSGCPKCAFIKVGLSNRLSVEDFNVFRSALKTKFSSTDHINSKEVSSLLVAVKVRKLERRLSLSNHVKEVSVKS